MILMLWKNSNPQRVTFGISVKEDSWKKKEYKKHTREDVNKSLIKFMKSLKQDREM
jgi:hypothetical protein